MAGIYNLKMFSKNSRQAAIDDFNVAVLIPCYNEELTVGQVIADFRKELPNAVIYVFDNNSTDRTTEVAEKAGAVVVRERRQGKGFVVQSMFRKIDADIYVMIDGDSTYPASDVRRLIEPVANDEADMVVGSRLHEGSRGSFKRLNLWGNRLFLSTLNIAFGVHLNDILSGYRVFSREFVKTVSLIGGGFEVETELTIKALEARFRVVEVPVNLTVRPEGSFSKIRHFRDGLRILGTIFALVRDYKPLTTFGIAALVVITAACIPGGIVIDDYLRTNAVLHYSCAVLAVGMTLIGGLLFNAGLILHCMTRRIREVEYQIRTNLIADHSTGREKARRQAG